MGTNSDLHTHVHRYVERDFKLSRGERRVFEVLAEGANGGEAARVLFLSYDTVRSHTSRVRQRLGVTSTPEAIGILRRLQQLPDGPCVCR